MRRSDGSHKRRRAAALLAGVSTVSVTLVAFAPLASAQTAKSTVVYNDLYRPGGLDFDTAGNIYIAGGQNPNVIKVNPVTGAATTLVSVGAYHAADVAVDPTGKVYIADPTNNALRLYDPAGGLTATIAGGLSQPRGLAMRADGNVYVSNTGAHEVDLWDSHTSTLSTVIPASAGLTSPHGLSVDSAGNVYIADANALKKWDATTQTVSTLVPNLYNVTGVAVEPNGDVLMAVDGAYAFQEWDHLTDQVSTYASTSAYGDSDAWDIGISPSGAVFGIGNYKLAKLSRIYDVPRNVTATRGDRSLQLGFDAPDDNGGSPVTGYESSLDNGATWQALTTSGSGPYQAAITGLTNGTSYAVRVRALTTAGAGPSATAATATPSTTPGAPVSHTATRGDGSIQVSFDAPDDNGGSQVTGYESSVDNGATWQPLTADGTGPYTGTVSGLTNGTSYSVLVRALNGAGASDASDGVTATPATTPAAPTGLATAPLLGAVRLTFTPAGNGGDAVTGYEVSTDGGTTFNPLSTTSLEDGKLTGTVTVPFGPLYTFTVRASNDLGAGASASAVGAPMFPIVIGPFPPFPPLPPVVAPMTAPTQLAASVGDGSTVLSFQPAGGGSAPISRYEVSTGGAWTTLATSPGTDGSLRATVSGLTNGLTYQVQLRGVGSSTSPVASTTVRPDPIPGKYAALGGSHSVLGSAIASEFPVVGGFGQRYEYGWIYWSPQSGVHEVNGAIATHYAALGGPNGLLGFPVTDERVTPDRIGRYTHFAGSGGASIYWTPKTGARSVHGEIRNRWAATGWERGPAGYPTTDESAAQGGRYNHFAGSGGSSIYWSPRTGAQIVYGGIHARWASLGYERSRLGFPTTGEYAVNGGRRSDFVGGSVQYSYASGRTTVLYR